MSELRTWTWDEICDLREDLEDEARRPGPRALPHAVYWIYGPRDLILYIGFGRDPRKRLAGHKSTQKNAWWPLVTGHKIVWFPNYAAARNAETAELRQHRPICNPVIPEADGKHITVTRDRKPVRSVWAHLTEVATERGEPIQVALDRLATERGRPQADRKGSGPTPESGAHPGPLLP